MTDLHNLIRDAQNFQKKGKLAEAKKLYQEALTVDNFNCGVLNNLGAIYLSEKNSQLAAEYFRKAVAIKPNEVSYLFNLARSLEINKNFAEASLFYRAAFNHSNNNKEIFFKSLTTTLKADDIDQAFAFLSSIRNLDVSEALVHSILLVYTNDQFKNHPGIVQSKNYIFHFFSDTNKLSRKDIIKYLRMNSKNDCFLILLIRRLFEIGFFNSTLDYVLNLVPLIKCNEEKASIPLFKGIAEARCGHDKQALQFFKAAYALDKDNTSVIDNLSYSLALNGDVTAAKKLVFENAIENMVMMRSLLDDREFERAWQLYCNGPGAGLRNPPIKGYSGEPLKDKTIFLYRDQGLGDEIMFLSCLPDLLNQQPKKISFECSPRLETLISRSFPSSLNCIPKDGSLESNDDFSWINNAEEFDLSINLSLLPAIYRHNLDSFYVNRKNGYLKASPDLKGLWVDRLSRLPNKLNIGFAWKGGVNFKRGITKKDLGALSSLFKYKNINWINLQYGDIQTEVKYFQSNYDVTLHSWPDLDYTADIENLCALINALDLVIQVNNTSLHLSAALGKETWALLPFGSFDMRWFQGKTVDDCPWYSNTKLFRQSYKQDLPSLINDVASQLRHWLENRND